MNPSKLQSEAVLELKEFYDADGTLHIGGERLIKLEKVIQDQIQKAYSEGFNKAVSIVKQNNDIAKDEEKHNWTTHCSCLGGTLADLEKKLLSIQSKEK